MQRKKYPELREHTATLILFYCIPRQVPSHKHSHKNPNEKRKKESRDFPLARRPTVRLPCASSHVRSSCLTPLVPRTSRARALLEPHAFLTHVFSAHTPDSPHVRAFRQAASQARPLSRASHPLFTSLHSQSTLSLTPHPQNSDSLRALWLSAFSPRPLLGAFSVSANRERTRCPVPGRSALRNQAEEEDALLPP